MAIEHETDGRGVCVRCGKKMGIAVNAKVWERVGGFPRTWLDTHPSLDVVSEQCQVAGPSGYPQDAFSTAEDYYPGGPIQGAVRPPFL